jgi:hypothetical protein
MLGYIFMVENTTNNKKYIGKYLSVLFDRHYFGDNEKLLDDIDDIGEDKFKITMLSACEDIKYVDAVYKAMLDKYNAESDPNFYNCSVKSESLTTTVKPKRSRKKKDESLS